MWACLCGQFNTPGRSICRRRAQFAISGPLASTRSTATTSSQIYLSRGVAGTKSEPVLPVLDLQPLHVASYFESFDTRRLSFSPRRLPLDPMSQDSVPIHNTSASASSSLDLRSESSPPPVNNTDKSQCSTKQSEALSHIFPHPTRGRNNQHSTKSSGRVVKRTNKGDNAKRLPSRPNAFHKYLSSLFNNDQESSVYLLHDQPISSASSSGSTLGSSVCSVAPSVDMVSPATFMFSGPSLRSGKSFSCSTSHIRGRTGTNSEAQITCRTRTDSFCMLDHDSIIDEEIMEPDPEHGITRVMSDVLLGVSTPNDEIAIPFHGSKGRPLETCHTPTLDTTYPRPMIAKLLILHLDAATRKSLRLTSRA